MAINPIIAMTIGYFGVVCLAFLIINFLQAGFLRIFMLVKGSRGKQIITLVSAVNRHYVRPGIVDNGWYIYKDGNGHEKRMKIPKDKPIFFRFLNVTWVTVDEEKNVFVTPDGKEVNGFDAEKYNNLYLRTLYRPAIEDISAKIGFILQIVDTLGIIVIIGLIAGVVIKNTNICIANTEQIKSYFTGLNATVV